MGFPMNRGLFSVLHRTDTHFECEEPGEVLRKDAFHYVADVKAGSIEEAYALTQNGNPNFSTKYNSTATWTKDARNYLTPEGYRLFCVPLNCSLRSTSVGDIIVDREGEAWMVGPMGWIRLNEDNGRYIVAEE
jgi:hypothetical protein